MQLRGLVETTVKYLLVTGTFFDVVEKKNF